MKIVLLAAAALSALTLSTPPAVAHGGRLNAQGCHNQRSNGTYHCHRSQGGSATSARLRPQALLANRNGGAFANCSAARAAGAAPVRRGDAGYGSHLDRDNDGVGCE